MIISEVATLTAGTVQTQAPVLDTTVSGAYTSDLLSDVMAHAGEGNLWVTLVTHQNIVAVAALVGLPAVLMIGGSLPDAETIAKAEQEQIIIMTSPLSAYEVCGRLYQAGLPVGGKACG